MDVKVTVNNIPDFLRMKSGVLSIWNRDFKVAGILKVQDYVISSKDRAGYAQIVKSFDRTPQGAKELVEYLNQLILRDKAEPIWIK